MARDRIYALPHSRVGDFTFDETVAEVFPDMIARSVPGYASILAMIRQLASRYVAPKTNVYDLGCSLGAATLLIRDVAPSTATIHAIDNSQPMITRLRKQLQQSNSDDACIVNVVDGDIRETDIQLASFVVLNLTLQFVPDSERRDLLQRIYEGMLPGGALLVSEKVFFDNAAEQELLTELHHDFKRANGYSDLEIAQKRTSLEKTLIPESVQTHVQRLQNVGFELVVPWFQCFNFVSILAVKAESKS